jgi:uncharacterized protein YdhG (YjbR/CyaY superfamily)
MKSGSMTKPNNIDEYIGTFPLETQSLLEQLRSIIQRSIPEAEEYISYGMPSFKFHGMLVYFAGYINHIGFYPGASGVETFKNELKEYKTSKGTIQFRLDKPLPIDLITRIVEFRVMENLEKKLAKAKKKNKKKK